MTDDQKKKIEFWLTSSDEDWQTAEDLLKKKHYVWTLFIIQLSLEKLIKALLIQDGQLPPLIHNLKNLYNQIDDVPEKYALWLDEISGFNLSARYDVEKQKLRKKANKEYSDEWYHRAKEIKQWLKKQLD